MLVSSIGGLRQIIVDASGYKFYQWEGKKAKKVEMLLGQILSQLWNLSKFHLYNNILGYTILGSNNPRINNYEP